MVRVVCICLIVAVATPQLARGKCLCPDKPVDKDLPPCCRASAQKKLDSQYGCCCCHRPNDGGFASPTNTQQRRAAIISSDCDCGRLRVIQPGWRWSPRRDIAREMDVLAVAVATSDTAWIGIQLSDDIKPILPSRNSTGPPIHVWNCVWLN